MTSTNAYQFSFAITEAGSTNILNATTSGTDANSLFTGGYAGLYSPTINAADPDSAYDTFRLETIPEPATLSLFGIATGVMLLLRRCSSSR